MKNYIISLISYKINLIYEESQGHLAFGPSLWRTKILQKLYDWEDWKPGNDECLYMWKKAHVAKYRIETLNMKAKHLNWKNNNMQKAYLKSLGITIKENKTGFSYYSGKIYSCIRNMITSRII